MGLHLIASIAWFLEPAHWLIVLKVGGGLGFVIFVHELGHFLVAKACGVKCEKFYVGFDIAGLKFFKFQWGETEYGIGVFPLGGYVKMLGQDDNPARIAEETRRVELQTAGMQYRAALLNMHPCSRTAIYHPSRFPIRTRRTIRAVTWRRACRSGWQSCRPASS